MGSLPLGGLSLKEQEAPPAEGDDLDQEQEEAEAEAEEEEVEPHAALDVAGAALGAEEHAVILNTADSVNVPRMNVYTTAHQ
jgi:hypothetical protein